MGLRVSEEEFVGQLQGCRRCFCTDVRMERARDGGAGDGESPWGLAQAEPLSSTASSL